MAKSYQFAKAESFQWAQYFSAFACTLSVFSSGIQFGWASPSLHKMEDKDSEIHITSDEGGWIATMLMFGAFVGCPFSVWILDRFSRKTVLLSTVVPHLASWILIIFATDHKLLLISRFIGGLALALSFGAAPMYISEISESNIRGRLGSVMPTMYNLGVLFSYVVAPHLSIPTFAKISACVPILFFFLFKWCPTSPYYLLQKDKPDEAKKNLTRLRGGRNIDVEFDRISQAIQEQKKISANMCDLFRNRIYLKSLFIMFGIRTVQQLSGIACFIFYAEKVFDEAGNVLNSSTSASLFALLQMVSCFLASSLLDRVGRKPLLIFSCLGSALCSSLLGFCLYRNQYNLFPELEVTWLPMTSSLAYILVTVLGLGVVPYVIVSELFPTHVKAAAVCCIMMYYDLSSVPAGKLYQVAADTSGTYVPFWCFTLCSLGGAAFVYYCVPETKGKCLEEIQDDMNRNNKICTEF